MVHVTVCRVVFSVVRLKSCENNDKECRQLHIKQLKYLNKMQFVFTCIWYIMSSQTQCLSTWQYTEKWPKWPCNTSVVTSCDCRKPYCMKDAWGPIGIRLWLTGPTLNHDEMQHIHLRIMNSLHYKKSVCSFTLMSSSPKHVRKECGE